MKLSVMLFPFHSLLLDHSLSAGDMVRSLKKFGAHGLEPMLPGVTGDAPVWEELIATARDEGMEFTCTDIGANLIGEDDAAREASVDTVKRGVDVCVEIGCPVALIPGTRHRPGMSPDEGRKIYSEMLARCAEATKGSGVVLTIEDFGVVPDLACSGRDCLTVIKGAGPEANIKMTFDNGNFLLADDVPVEAYALLRDDIVHVHIKDFVIGGESLKSPTGVPHAGCLIGDGAGQVVECLDLLKQDKYKGWISLEANAADAQQGCDFIRQCWGA
jgi:sugar phosphate isomerase/epimerase